MPYPILLLLLEKLCMEFERRMLLFPCKSTNLCRRGRLYGNYFSLGNNIKLSTHIKYQHYHHMSLSRIYYNKLGSRSCRHRTTLISVVVGGKIRLAALPQLANHSKIYFSIDWVKRARSLFWHERSACRLCVCLWLLWPYFFNDCRKIWNQTVFQPPFSQI